MEKFNIFQDIAQRTGGDIYIGVVGPVRTGKSTFIRKFMERLVLPRIEDEFLRTRMLDELPQSGAGRTIMTVEPKFIPEEAVELTPHEGITVRVRLIDVVGYPVEGALGFLDETGQPRMVLTPWFDAEVPLHEAAEIGTRKVIAEHATLGVVVTTDGTITDIARGKYIEAEERVVAELKELGKPFVVVLNTTRPYAQETLDLAGELEEKYGAPIIPTDVSELTEDDVHMVLEQLLLEFPVRELEVRLPRWVEELDSRQWLREKFETAVAEVVQAVTKVRDVDQAVERLASYEFVETAQLRSMDMGTGTAVVELEAREDLYYQILEEIAGVKLEGKHTMVRLLREWAVAKQEYDKIAVALHEVRETGYGMVPPQLSDMTFDEPELVRQGSRFGVRLRASAPSLHFIRADIHTEVTPIIGTEKQGEELVQYLMEKFEDDPKKLWDFDIFGKSLYELVRDGVQNKLYRMPEDAQQKLQETLTRIINEGSGGLICIII
ncbi:stage IV sporulation protein A [Caldinitratiruptor microaerophilus]|uniref:Stage IV sporulation protein A n=1 Tax=Caldinitratiruptor microaerophilus TaxID=671077 RepID=A0AA35CMN1_9FIRM|nr:stage IV sporulation protein A [Caldinitratiruptor microaerophilus]BDG60100.1 stage IV sporulation protein A [Caldinitratiruptor microaerophilus]